MLLRCALPQEEELACKSAAAESTVPIDPFKSVPSLAQRAPSSVTLRFAQGKPSVHPRLISFATLTAGLRSIFALSCFVRPPNSQPLTTFILSTFPHQQRWSHLIFHFVHFFLNKAAGCAIHTVLVLRHSPDGALLNSSRSGNHFVAFSRLTNGGSVPSDWILFSNGRDDLCILPRGRDDLRLSALTLISSAARASPGWEPKVQLEAGLKKTHRVFSAVVVAAFVPVEATLLSLE